MRQMYCTVARETKLTLSVVLCVKSCQEVSEYTFRRGKGQNTLHFKAEDGHLCENVKLELKIFNYSPDEKRG